MDSKDIIIQNQKKTMKKEKLEDILNNYQEKLSGETKINSNIRPSLVGDYLFTVSIEGYLFVIEKNTGNIIRVTDIFSNFKTIFSF